MGEGLPLPQSSSADRSSSESLSTPLKQPREELRDSPNALMQASPDCPGEALALRDAGNSTGTHEGSQSGDSLQLMTRPH